MLDTESFARQLLDRVDFFGGVPVSFLNDFNNCLRTLTPAGNFWTSANEGSAVAMACGHYLATGRPGAVYMQNSGLGNALNPLLSLCDPLVYNIPVLLIIGWRGQPGVKDEPQHRKQGLITDELLSVAGIRSFLLPESLPDAKNVLEQAFDILEKEKKIVAVLVKKGTFSVYNSIVQSNNHQLKREEAIKVILSALDDECRVVSTTGMISRELFELREIRGESHARDFLTIGAMGHASQIAHGLAINRPDKKIVCLDGDGAMIMHMGGMATIGTSKIENFIHIVLNNAAHDSVGGQPTAADRINLPKIALACGYTDAESVDDADNLRQRLTAFLEKNGCFFIEAKVSKGARKDLGRPSLSTWKSLEV